MKLNLDAYRGAEGAPNSGPLFKVVLAFIADIAVVDPLTVKVTMNVPVANFGGYLFSTGRFGMMAPAQLNAGEDCATKWYKALNGDQRTTSGPRRYRRPPVALRQAYG